MALISGFDEEGEYSEDCGRKFRPDVIRWTTLEERMNEKLTRSVQTKTDGGRNLYWPSHRREKGR
jgi:hypothetical protein